MDDERRAELVDLLASNVSGVGESRAEEVLDHLDAKGAFSGEDIDEEDYRRAINSLEQAASVLASEDKSKLIRLDYAQEKVGDALMWLRK